MKELIVRINTRLKRAQRHTTQIEKYTLGQLEFNFQAMTATCKGNSLDFSVRELELLRYCIMHKGRVLTRQQILEDVWHYELEQVPSTRSIDNYIMKLRQKIEPAPDNPKYLITVYGKGYRFEG